MDDLRSVAIPVFVSRAGAAALAAPDPTPAELDELADDTAGCVAAIFASGAALEEETLDGEAIEGEATSSLMSKMSASLS